MSGKPVRWVDVAVMAEGGLLVSVDARAFFAAVERVGVPRPASDFTSYPRWAQVAFWAGGEDGLRAAHEAGAAGQAAVESALALGGKEAVAAVLRGLTKSPPVHDALVPPGYP